MKSNKNYHKDMIESIKDYTKHYTIIRGYCDVFIDPNRTLVPLYSVTNNDYWIVLGNLSDEAIDDLFEDSSFSDEDGIEREGCYEYSACLYYSSGSWDEQSESYIDYIDFNFVETFEGRDRDKKLNELLGFDF